MFNGIIFNQGKIKKIIKRKKGSNLFLKSNLKLSNFEKIAKKIFKNFEEVKTYTEDDKVLRYY